MAVCINKADLNNEMTARIEEECHQRNVPVVGHVPFDPALTRAQIRGISVIEDEPSDAATAIGDVWRQTKLLLNQPKGAA
jgi:MinD superfamily P-loop ATPase